MSLLVRSTASRSIAVKVNPRPRNIADSSHILKILRGFGEVETFKHLKYEASNPAPNRYTVIFKNAASASKAIAADGMEFTFPDQHTSSQPLGGSDVGNHKPIEFKRQPSRRSAKLSIGASYVDHEEYIRRQPYHGSYSRTFGTLYDDIAPRLPKGLQGMAYIDFNKGETPLRLRMKRDEERAQQKLSLRELWKQSRYRTTGKIDEMDDRLTMN